MNVCTNCDIAFVGTDCPMCKIEAEHYEYIKDNNEDIDELVKRIKYLEEKVEAYKLITEVGNP